MTTVPTEELRETEPDRATGPPIGWSFLRSRRWLGYYAMLLVFAVACVLLADWQFDRRAEARAEIARIDANYGAPAVPLADELPTLESYDDGVQKWRTVEVTGEYLDDTFLARNRPGPEGVGVALMQPLLTASGDVFFIDRGWAPVGADGTEPDEIPRPADGPVTVEARLRASEPDVPGRSAVGQTVGSINLPELAALADTEGATYIDAYGMLISESPVADHGVLPAPPERDEGPHLSYALQWYVFIVIAVSGVVYAARQEYRNLNVGSSEVDRQDRRRAERRHRRGPSDADEEDAILDG
ncbi:SURF1 family protein [Leucobacter tardus]|uniref:SURF1-like protein n=1 Tax=Leucobacter tardus TaxID=501483 RepID=A0A939TNA9_9MICO|nr:SURF1 family protein [Leucobacter tardus]MBO2990014.1 SURF1 family protein [Leucobacter tardus]